MELKVGGIYRVGTGGAEHNNIIQITERLCYDNNIVEYCYRTLSGMKPASEEFEEDSIFAGYLIPFTGGIR